VAQIRYGLIRQTEDELNKLPRRSTQDRASHVERRSDEEDVASIVSKWTGIPVSKMLEARSRS